MQAKCIVLVVSDRNLNQSKNVGSVYTIFIFQMITSDLVEFPVMSAKK